MTDQTTVSTFAAFWLYRATEARFELEPDDAAAIPSRRRRFSTTMRKM
ncbi:MAG: hypothetical protein R2848_13760 [Thermomicrobiales bacterium]